MRVVVLGASGLLGSSLVPYLRACGHEVLGVARKAGADERADLTDPDRVGAVLGMLEPEVVVNLAALTNVDECERNPQHSYLMNVRIVENLTAWIHASGKSCHLVQVSTDHVYDGKGPHVEDDITLTNYYAFSKYAGELAAAAVSSTVLRTNFFGPNQCPGRMTLSDWLVQSLVRRDPITVYEDVRFSPLSLQHLVELMECVLIKRCQGVFNLGSKEGMSKADFAFAVALALELPTRSMKRGRSDMVTSGAYRPKDMRMNSHRFEAAFGVGLPTLNEEIQLMRAAYANYGTT